MTWLLHGLVDNWGILMLCAKSGVMFFHLYYITGRDHIRYVYSNFPIVEREEVVRWWGT
ncbi:MAG: hypothetical protein GDA36_12275 [Rhodobacteraceae bacterium]|nr:hypothetical protein [Paracoccaceae bacterium]